MGCFNKFLRYSAVFASNNYHVAVALFVFAFSVYLPCTFNSEKIWDDHYLVESNPLFRSPKFVLEVFRHPLYLDKNVGYYRPVQNLSYMLDYCVFGDSTFVYHLSNIAMHALAAFLIFLLLKGLLPRLGAPKETSTGMAALISLIWCIHPIHNAAVAYISGRANTLAAIFAVGAWLLCERGLANGHLCQRILCFLGAGLSFFLALGSKEIAITWAMIFIITSFTVNRDQPLRSRWFSILGLLSVFGIYLGFRLSLPGSPMTNGAEILPWFDRFCLANRAFGTYIGLIFCPISLHMERLVYIKNAHSPGVLGYIRDNYLVWLGLVSILASALMLRLKGPGRGLRWYGFGWFLLGFLPISNLFPLNAQAAEHWIYMPSIGLLVCLAGCVMAFSRWQSALTAAVMVAIIPLGIRTGLRAWDWADEGRFFQQTIIASGYSLRPMNNMLRVLMLHKENDRAVEMMKLMVTAYPNLKPLRSMVAGLLTTLGHEKEAAQYQTDVETIHTQDAKSSDTWTAIVGRYVLKKDAGRLAKAGRYDEALRLLDQVPEENKSAWDIKSAQANILILAQRYDEAISLLKQYTANRWWDYQSHFLLATLEYRTGRLSDALKTAEDTAELDIRDTNALALVTMIYEDQKEYFKAISVQRRIMEREPQRYAHYVHLAILLGEAGQTAEASEARKIAQMLASNARKSGFSAP
jgi:tetratricopeptide (TPR) repeat protein